MTENSSSVNEFLEDLIVLLREEGYSISPEKYLEIFRVLENSSNSLEDLKFVIRAIVCKSQKEQQRFDELWKFQHEQNWVKPEKTKKQNPRLKWLITAIVLMNVAAIVTYSWRSESDLDELLIENDSTNFLRDNQLIDSLKLAASNSAENFKEVADNDGLLPSVVEHDSVSRPMVNIEERAKLEQASVPGIDLEKYRISYLTGVLYFRYYLKFFFFLLLALESFLYIRKWLKKRKLLGSATRKAIVIKPPSFKSASIIRKRIFGGLITYRQSHSQKSGNHELDIYKSIKSTIRNAGFAEIHYKGTSVTENRIFLIEADSRKNHLHSFIEELIYSHQRIRLLYFKQDPRICWDPSENNKAVKLNNLQGSSIVIFSPCHFFTDLDRKNFKASISKLFDKFNEKTIVTTKPYDNWNLHEHILKLKFQVLELNPETLSILSLTNDSLLPKSYLGNPNTVLETELTSVMEYLKGMKFSLQKNELMYSWIAACCLFSKIDWELTFVIGYKLFKSENQSLSMNNLFVIANISWFKNGSIPVKAREEMLARKDLYAPELWNKVQSILEEFLDGKTLVEPSEELINQLRSSILMSKILSVSRFEGKGNQLQKLKENLYNSVEKDELKVRLVDGTFNSGGQVTPIRVIQSVFHKLRANLNYRIYGVTLCLFLMSFMWSTSPYKAGVFHNNGGFYKLENRLDSVLYQSQIILTENESVSTSESVSSSYLNKANMAIKSARIVNKLILEKYNKSVEHFNKEDFDQAILEIDSIDMELEKLHYNTSILSVELAQDGTLYATGEDFIISAENGQSQLTYNKLNYTGRSVKSTGSQNFLSVGAFNDFIFDSGDSTLVTADLNGLNVYNFKNSKAATETLSSIPMNSLTSSRDGNLKWAVGNGGSLSSYTTENGWQSSNVLTDHNLNSVLYVDDLKAIYAVGDDGNVFIKGREKTTWNQIDGMEAKNIYDISYSDRTFWLVGEDGLIISSDIFFKSMKVYKVTNKDLFSVAARNGQVWIGGADGTLLSSNDKGSSWVERETDLFQKIAKISGQFPSVRQNKVYQANTSGLIEFYRVTAQPVHDNLAYKVSHLLGLVNLYKGDLKKAYGYNSLIPTKFFGTVPFPNLRSHLADTKIDQQYSYKDDWQFLSRCSCLRRIVAIGDEYSIVDGFGNPVTESTYQSIEPYDLGTAFAKQNGKFKYIDLMGQFHSTSFYNSPRLVGSSTFELDNLDKMMKSNRIISIEDVRDQHQLIKTATNKFGLMSDKGKLIIEPIYSEVQKLPQDGYLIFKDLSRHEHKIYDLLGKNNFTLELDSIQVLDKVLMLYKDQRLGCIIHDTRQLIPLKYDWISIGTENPIGLMKVEGKFGYFNSYGKEVITQSYDHATHFLNGMATVSIGTHEFVINSEGDCIKNCDNQN